MAKKQSIIDNVAEYTPAELARYIRDGVVTFEELCDESEFSASSRKEVKNLISNSEEEDWQNALAIDSIEEYDRYLQSYPEGKHRGEAREAKKKLFDSSHEDEITQIWEGINKDDDSDLRKFISEHPTCRYTAEARNLLSTISRRRYTASAIKRLKQDIEGEKNSEKIVDIIKEYLDNNSISIDQLYTEIGNNHNIFSSYVIDRLEEEGVIDFTQLETIAKINPKFFEFITNKDVNSQVINVPSTRIDAIGPKTTEVYFWGIPSSGKTCALGAIMSEARHGGYIDFAEPNNRCQGYHYMTVLSQIFEGGTEVFKLPEGTQTDDIFEMGYIFKKGKMDYPVTFIDLAGETIGSMFKRDAQIPLTRKQEDALGTACKLLKGNPGVNRKIHFFVIEYNGHNKMYEQWTQETLLTGAMTFIKNTGIFRTETDAIYLLLTKSDLIGASTEQDRNRILADYIKTHYKGFYNGLKSICAETENEINEGNVDIVPFSLGDVCFQNLCLFDHSTAATVVELIINRAKGFKSGKLAKIFKIFKR